MMGCMNIKCVTRRLAYSGSHTCRLMHLKSLNHMGESIQLGTIRLHELKTALNIIITPDEYL